MAMTSRTAPAGKDESKLPLGEQVTYLPTAGDPPSIKWHGIVFHANVPKPVNKPELIAAARENRFFKVGPFDPATDSTAALENADAAAPKTAEEYRAHFVAWLRKTETIHDLIKNWTADTALRQSCEVGSDDYSYIASLFLPKQHELARIAGLQPQQLATLWAEKGVFELPF